MPDDIEIGKEVYVIREHIAPVFAQDGEGGGVNMAWACLEHCLYHNEYNKLLEGKLDGGWTTGLHKIYREAQHQKADGLLAIAYRKQRQSDYAPEWEEYISALDKWNDEVSAMASTLSVALPELPTPPK